jgi:hypothetical protein
VNAGPTEAATLERCSRLVAVELQAVALQRRRLRRSEPEDDNEDFELRWWIDLQFFIVALARLRRALRVLNGTPNMSNALQAAVASFDARTLSLHTMRNIGEHANEYAIDSPKRHVKTLDRKQLEMGSWDGKTFKWLQESDGDIPRTECR